MLSHLVRRTGSRRAQQNATATGASRPSPSPGPAYERRRHATADFTEADDNDDDSNDDEEGADEDEERLRRASMPVLPLFSATYLDSLPVYNITHAIRIIVSSRTETTLTWDQLRSPQVSQFLVKPMQQQVRAEHFSRATLYALMANCLQFAKEAQLYPGNAGTSNTRAKVCELLAVKLLKEYTTRELIDALSYDFFPLQGSPSASNMALTRRDTNAKAALIASRTSTLEVAIRASAKHFLAHPLVVQQLEAIWNGAITFYSAADRLHRNVPSSPATSSTGKPDARTPLLSAQHQVDSEPASTPGRRTVALYDPRQASLFKLSRLRVPRYRFFLGTMSLAILIALFLAVCLTRSPQITSLELVFWFWSAGFMLDELVGFNEQGFALYIMSPWNLIDLGILVLLIIYYCMRAYGVFLIDPHHWNSMAYDVLAANAILLLPRVFSVLDHYRYFSQLLIAFRLMAVDLAAVLVLVLISCSGFFVFFTMSRAETGGGDVAYQIFQILMGYTPAAWEMWPSYSVWEKSIMVLFLIICHFVVVTILITVLTNSFMAIASNANEEHQFLFAINTISMVKNDALFSYIAPSNIFAWLLIPLRYCMPLRYFVWLNRIIIKVTHFPLLFCIFLYERYWLATSMFEPTDLVEYATRHGRTLADPANRTLFSPQALVREESIAGFQKDRALEEVFRRVPGVKAFRTHRRQQRRKRTDIRNWMEQADVTGPPLSHWPTIDSRVTHGNNEWSRRYSLIPERTARPRHISDARSAASDPANTHSLAGQPPRYARHEASAVPEPGYRDMTDADGDGDDELVTNDEEEEEEQITNAGEEGQENSQHEEDDEEYFTTPVASKFNNTETSSLDSVGQYVGSPPPQTSLGMGRNALHHRTMSSNTILFSPQAHADSSDGTIEGAPRASNTRSSTGVQSPGPDRRRSAYNTVPTRPRPVISRGLAETLATAGRTPYIGFDATARNRAARPRIPSMDMSVTSDNVNLVVEDPTNMLSSSFQTQMVMAMEKNRMLARASSDSNDTSDRLSKLVLSRITQMEQNLADVAKEMRELRGSSTMSVAGTAANSSSDNVAGQGGAQESRGHTRTQSGSALLSRKIGLKSQPGSRRSLKDATRLTLPPDIKGKGRDMGTTPEDAEHDTDEGFTMGRRQSPY